MRLVEAGDDLFEHCAPRTCQGRQQASWRCRDITAINNGHWCAELESDSPESAEQRGFPNPARSADAEQLRKRRIGQQPLTEGGQLPVTTDKECMLALADSLADPRHTLLGPSRTPSSEPSKDGSAECFLAGSWQAVKMPIRRDSGSDRVRKLA